MGGAIQRDQRAAVVSTATVLLTLQVTGTQHVGGEVELGDLGALGVLDDGDGHPAQDGGGGGGDGGGGGGGGVAPAGPPAPAGHAVEAERQQLALGEVFSGETDRDDEAAQRDGTTQLQQGDVTVAAGRDVTRVADRHRNRHPLLGAVVNVQVVFTWKQSDRKTE